MDLPADAAPARRLMCPFELTVEPIARFLNCEFPDDPQYDGLELQWYDDDVHGTGLVVLLSRRQDRAVDVYAAPGLTLDPARFVIGGGPGAWTETIFDVGRLVVADDGVAADVGFTDRHGQRIEVVLDDRDGRSRRRGTILAPVSSGTERPNSLLLVHLHGFDLLHGYDLVRRSRRQPVVRIGERTARTGALPGGRLHRRELVKYAAPLDVISLNQARDGAVPLIDHAAPDGARLAAGGIASLVQGAGASRVRLELRPPFPDLAQLPDGARTDGVWRVYAEGVPPLTGGTWSAMRQGTKVQVEMAATERWRPGRLPPLIAVVTRVVPVFRRWPTTYRWHAVITLGAEPRMVSAWERTGERDVSYRTATQRRSKRT